MMSVNRVQFAALSLGAPGWLVPIVLTGIAFAGLIIWAYRNSDASLVSRIIAAALKASAVVLLLICLLDPLRSTERPRPGVNQFAIVVDNSKSMTIEGRGLPANEAFQNWLGTVEDGWRAELGRDFDVRLYAFDRDIRPIDAGNETLDFTQSHSNLNAALRSVRERLGQNPLAGILLFTDGNATDAPVDDDALSAVPVYTVVPAALKMPVDLALRDVSVSETLFETSPTTVTASVVAHGLQGRQLEVQLVDVANATTIETRKVISGKDGESVAVKFEFRPTAPSLSFYQLRVVPVGGNVVEATTENNQRTVLVNRGGGPFRILYVAGRPNWEFKFLRRALEKDDEIQLVSLLRIAKKAPKFAFRDKSGTENRLFEGFDETSKEEEESYDQPVLVRLGVKDSTELAEGFPATEDILYQYDAVIIDDLESSFFSPDQLMLLRRFVSERGGGLLMLGGLATHHQGGYGKTPLGELLPVYLRDSNLGQRDITRSDGPLHLSITREGMLETWARLRATEVEEQRRIKAMPSFKTLNRVGQIKPGAITIAEVQDGSQTLPAIVTQRFGNGRTASLLLGDIWRWAMRRQPGDKQTESDHDSAVFWRQAARWLVSDVPRRVTIDIDATTSGKQPVMLRAQVLDPTFRVDDNASVKFGVTPPDGNTIEISTTLGENAGSYEAEYWPVTTGGYVVTAHVATADGSPLPPHSSAFVFAPNESEFDPLMIDQARLAHLARDTDGLTVAPDMMRQFVKQLETRPVPVTELRIASLWHQAWIFTAATLLLCAEWGLRRWKGFA